MDIRNVTPLKNAGATRADLKREEDGIKVRDTRIITLLAVALLAGASVMDIWAVPSAFETVFKIRLACIAGVLGLYGLTYSKIFLRYYAPIVIVAYGLMAIAVDSAIYLAAPDEYAKHIYFAGIMLMLMGIYTWIHLPVRVTDSVSAALIAIYAAVVWVDSERHGEIGGFLGGYLFFIVSTMVVGHISQQVRIRYASQNRHLRIVLQKEVEQKERDRQNSEIISHHDPLTGLANRLQLDQRASELLEEVRERGTCLAVMFLDLDKFKPINDTYGHQIGDDVLKLLAQRLQHCIRPSDIIARIGGDEFVIVLETTQPDSGIAETLANKAAAAITKPVRIDQHTHSVKTSIGIAQYPVDGDDFDTLLGVADQRMYNAKRGIESHPLDLNASGSW